jgi:hypothetical protein
LAENGGSIAVEWYTNFAIANARKYGKENVERKKCQYFNKALKNPWEFKQCLKLGTLNLM